MNKRVLGKKYLESVTAARTLFHLFLLIVYNTKPHSKKNQPYNNQQVIPNQCDVLILNNLQLFKAFCDYRDNIWFSVFL